MKTNNRDGRITRKCGMEIHKVVGLYRSRKKKGTNMKILKNRELQKMYLKMYHKFLLS